MQHIGECRGRETNWKMFSGPIFAFRRRMSTITELDEVRLKRQRSKQKKHQRIPLYFPRMDRLPANDCERCGSWMCERTMCAQVLLSHPLLPLGAACAGPGKGVEHGVQKNKHAPTFQRIAPRTYFASLRHLRRIVDTGSEVACKQNQVEQWSSRRATKGQG